MKKQVLITCKGAAELELSELETFQGKLKSLSDESYEKLKASILELGFSFPVFAWRNGKKISIIDAHQRVEALKRMKLDGYSIPKLPIVWIEASDKKEAAKKLLAVSSQYGDISLEGLNQFLTDFDIKIDDLESMFKVPNLDIDSFRLAFSEESLASSFEKSNKDWKGMPEFVQEDKRAFRSIIIHFFDQKGVDNFAKLIKQNITDKTKMTWYPEIVIEKYMDKRYANKKT